MNTEKTKKMSNMPQYFKEYRQKNLQHLRNADQTVLNITNANLKLRNKYWSCYGRFEENSRKFRGTFPPNIYFAEKYLKKLSYSSITPPWKPSSP